MTTDELLNLVTDLLRDYRKPKKWSDELKLLYLNEAQTKLVEKSQANVFDNVEMVLDAGEGAYELAPEILKVFSVRIDGAAYPLQFSTENWTPSESEPGTPVRYTLDAQTQTIRFYPAPDAATLVKLRVGRAPKALTLDARNAKCELLDRHQIPLADWATYRCLTHDDPDGRNDQAAALAKARFEEATRDVKRSGYQMQFSNNARVHGHRVP